MKPCVCLYVRECVCMCFFCDPNSFAMALAPFPDHCKPTIYQQFNSINTCSITFRADPKPGTPIRDFSAKAFKPFPNHCTYHNIIMHVSIVNTSSHHLQDPEPAQSKDPSSFCNGPRAPSTSLQTHNISAIQRFLCQGLQAFPKSLHICQTS